MCRVIHLPDYTFQRAAISEHPTGATRAPSDCPERLDVLGFHRHMRLNGLFGGIMHSESEHLIEEADTV